MKMKHAYITEYCIMLSTSMILITHENEQPQLKGVSNTRRVGGCLGFQISMQQRMGVPLQPDSTAILKWSGVMQTHGGQPCVRSALYLPCLHS